MHYICILLIFKIDIVKNFVLIFFALALFASCSSDPREQIISDYEQTSGDTKTDLSLKVLKIENLKPFRAIDSLKILLPVFEYARDEKIADYQIEINKKEKEIKENEKDVIKQEKVYGRTKWDLDKRLLQTNKNLLDANKMTLKLYNKYFNAYKTDCKGTKLEVLYNRIQEYKKDTSKILYNKAKATYSIKNPMMNFAKQEITKTYMFTPDNKSILGVIE